MDNQISTVVDMLRARDRLTKAQLAARAGLPLRTLSRRLNGGGHWEVGEVAALADVFDVPITVLLDGPTGLLRGAVTQRYLSRTAAVTAAA